MKFVEVFRNLPGLDSAESAVDDSKIRVGFLRQADKSDPLNQLVVAHFVANERFALKVSIARAPGVDAEAEALRVMAAAIVEHYAEIRDAIAE